MCKVLHAQKKYKRFCIFNLTYIETERVRTIFFLEHFEKREIDEERFS